MKNIGRVLGVSVAVGMVVSMAWGKEPVKTNPYQKLLRNVPVLEVPAQAAKIIKEAKDAERDQVTAQVIAAVAEFSPAAIPLVVGTIARTAPQAAATASAVAAAFVPDLAPAIVRAVVTVLPSQTSTIVQNTCTVLPTHYESIAKAAAEAAPGQAPVILATLGNTFPTMKDPIAQALSANTARDISVDNVIANAAKIAGPMVSLTPVQSSSANLEGTFTVAGSTPILGPPFQTLGSISPAETTPSSTEPVPVGGRNYARP